MLLEGWGQPGEDLARRPADALVVRHDQRGRHAGLGVHKLQWGEGEAGLTLCPIWGHSLGENSPALVRGCLVNNDPRRPSSCAAKCLITAVCPQAHSPGTHRRVHGHNLLGKNASLLGSCGLVLGLVGKLVLGSRKG